MDEKELKALGSYIAQALIEQGLKSGREDWIDDDSEDHLLGELARCLTLQNLYLDREEYEKCAIMKIKISDLNEKLNIKEDLNPGDIQDGTEM